MLCGAVRCGAVRCGAGLPTCHAQHCRRSASKVGVVPSLRWMMLSYVVLFNDILLIAKPEGRVASRFKFEHVRVVPVASAPIIRLCDAHAAAAECSPSI